MLAHAPQEPRQAAPNSSKLPITLSVGDQGGHGERAGLLVEGVVLAVVVVAVVVEAITAEGLETVCTE